MSVAVEEFQRRAELKARAEAGDPEAVKQWRAEGWDGESEEASPDKPEQEKHDRSRLAIVTRTLEERREERAKKEAELVELRQREEQAVSEAVRKAPTQRAYAVGTEPMKLRDRAEKLERTLPALDVEIAELERVEAELRNEDAQKVFERYRSDVRKLRDRQIEALRSAGLDFARLVRDYLAMASAAEAVGELRERAIQEGVVPDAESWSRECRPALSPYPTDIKRFLEKLCDAAIDPHSHGYREDSSGALRADHGGLLKTLTPDLRRIARNSYPMGNFDRTASEGWLSGQQPRWSHLPDPGSLEEIIAGLEQAIEGTAGA